MADIQLDDDLSNNIRESTFRVKVRILGEINGDGKVDDAREEAKRLFRAL